MVAMTTPVKRKGQQVRRGESGVKIPGRRALVTGSTSGIGYAIAEGLAREGAQVVLNGRQVDSLERAVARIKAAVKGARVVGVVANAATAEGAKTIVRPGAGRRHPRQQSRDL